MPRGAYKVDTGPPKYAYRYFARRGEGMEIYRGAGVGLLKRLDRWITRPSSIYRRDTRSGKFEQNLVLPGRRLCDHLGCDDLCRQEAGPAHRGCRALRAHQPDADGAPRLSTASRTSGSLNSHTRERRRPAMDRFWWFRPRSRG
jgi:hypothetical protein